MRILVILVNHGPVEKYYDAGADNVSTELRGACLEITLALDKKGLFDVLKEEVKQARATKGVNEQLWSREMRDYRRAVEDLDGYAARNLVIDYLEYAKVIEVSTVTQEDIRKKG